jgi:hypothetical protein
MPSSLTVQRNLPCLNPNCRSHGTPHPNCRCYGFAEGGDVSHFCSASRAHNKDCKYFADGGDLGFVPDAQAAPQDDGTGFIPDTADTSHQELGFVPDTNDDKYGTPGQQLLTGVEGAASGYLPGVATTAELGAHKLGLDTMLGIDTSAEAQIGRQEANPGIHLASEIAGTGAGFLSGTGEIGLIERLSAGAAEHLAPEVLGKAGQVAIKNFIQMGTIQGGDEVSKYLLGQNSDPTAAAASMLASGALGSGVGLLGTGTAGLLKKIPNLGLGDKLVGLPTGIGAALRSEELKEALPLKDLIKKWKGMGMNNDTISGIKFGNKIGNILTNNIYGHGLGLLQAEKGYEENGLLGAVWGGLKGEALGMALGYGITKANSKITIPMLFKLMNTNTMSKGVELLNNAPTISEGVSSIENGVQNLFNTATQKGVNKIATDKDKDKLNEFIGNGGLNQQIQNQLSQGNLAQPGAGFAVGGLVQNNHSKMRTGAIKSEINIPNMTGSPSKDNYTTSQSLSKPVQQALDKPVLQGTDAISEHYPELGMMLGAAKGRVNEYLNSQRPTPNQPKPAFDEEPSQTEQKRSYNKALDIAIQPLSVLNHIKEGTLTPEHVQHLNSMYPELKTHLDKKITERITKAQMDGEKPSYRVRQGLSMFLNAPLSGELTQPNIAAAQAVFAQQAAQAPQGQPVTKNKKSTSSLKKVSEQYQTSTDAAIARQQNGS